MIHKECLSCGKIGHKPDMVRKITTPGIVEFYYHPECIGKEKCNCQDGWRRKNVDPPKR